MGDDLEDDEVYGLDRSPFANPFRQDSDPEPVRQEYRPQQPAEQKRQPEPAEESVTAAAPAIVTPQPQEEKEEGTKVVQQPIAKVEEPKQEETVVNMEPQHEETETQADTSALPQPQAPTQAQSTAGKVNPELVEAVVELINANMPPMMKQYIDTATQRSDVEKALAPHMPATAPCQEPEPDATPATGNKLADLQARFKTVDMQRRAAQNRANDLSVRITALSDENERLEIERKGLLNKVKVLKYKCGMADGDPVEMPANDETQAQLDKAKEELEQLKAELSKANDTIKQQAEEIENSNKSAEEKDETIQSLKAEIEEANENLKICDEIEKRIAEFEEFKKRNKAEKNALKEHIAQLEKREDTVSDELKAQLQLTLEQNAKFIQEIEQLNQKARETNDKHNRRDIELANRINDLKSQVQSAARLAEGYKDSLDEQIKAADEARAKLSKSDERCESLKSQLAQARDENKAVRKEARDAKEQNTLLQNQLAQLQENIGSNDNTIKAANEVIEKLNEELKAARTLNDDLHEQLNKNDKVQSNLDSALAQLKETKRLADNLNNQVKGLKQELTSTRGELKAATASLETEKRDKAALQLQLDDALKAKESAKPDTDVKKNKKKTVQVVFDDVEEPAEILAEEPVVEPIEDISRDDVPVAEEPVLEVKPTEPAPEPAPAIEEAENQEEVQEEAATVAQEEEEPSAQEKTTQDDTTPLATTPVAHTEPEDDKGLGITLDDIDDVDWLIPVEPDPIPEPEPEPEPEPAPEPKPKADPRQLSLW